MNAVIYSRVSTQDQDNSRQIAELRDYAKFKKYEVLKVFEEKISGATKAQERTEFKRLLDFIEKNKVNHVLVWELSRLGRKMKDVSDTIENLSDKGVNIYIKKEGFNTLDEKGKKSIMTSMIISILSGFAEMERETIKLRSSSGIRANVSNGGSGTGIIKPYGFKKVDKKLVIDKEEAAIVKLIFEKYQSGLGTLKIANYLNTQNVKTRFNKIFNTRTIIQKHGFEKKGEQYTWKDGTVYSILTNTIYKGERNHKGEVFKIDPIIEPETFDRVQKLLSKNRNKGTTETVNQNILKDIIICGKCGRSYYLHKRSNGKDNAYKCLSKRYNENCGNPSVNIDKLNDALFKVCQDMIFSDAIEKKPSAKKTIATKRENINIELETIDKELEGLAKKSDKALDAYLSNLMKKPKLIELQNNIQNQTQKLLDKKEKLVNDLERIKQLENRTTEKNDLYDVNMFKEYIKSAVEFVKVYGVGEKGMKRLSDIYPAKHDVAVIIQVKSTLDFVDDRPVYRHFALSRRTDKIAFIGLKSATKPAAGQIEKGEFTSDFSIALDEIEPIKNLKNPYIKKRISKV